MRALVAGETRGPFIVTSTDRPFCLDDGACQRLHSSSSTAAKSLCDGVIPLFIYGFTAASETRYSTINNEQAADWA